MYIYYGIQSHFYNQLKTQHTDSYDCVRMHVYMHLAFKELSHLDLPLITQTLGLPLILDLLGKIIALINESFPS